MEGPVAGSGGDVLAHVNPFNTVIGSFVEAEHKTGHRTDIRLVTVVLQPLIVNSLLHLGPEHLPLFSKLSHQQEGL